MEILAGSTASGLLIGMVFALIALGLTIIFGMMDIVNFAHGEFLMLGMYATLLSSQATGLDPLATIPIAQTHPPTEIDQSPILGTAGDPRGVFGSESGGDGERYRSQRRRQVDHPAGYHGVSASF